MIVHTETKSLILKLREPEKVQQLFPQSKRIDYQGHNIAVPHRLDEVVTLNNMGIKAPSPILHYYDWSGRFTPYAHQLDTAAKLTLNRKMIVLNGVGSGKSKSLLWASDFLMREGKVKKALIVSPLSTLDPVWAAEIFETLMHRTCMVLHGSRETRLEALQADVDYYIINTDGIKVIHHELLKRTDIDLLIVDEASKFRNAKSDRYTMLKSLIKPTTRLWLATATPTPKDPTDAWALARLINPKGTPEYFGQFKRMTMDKISEFRWVARPNAMQIVYDVLQPAVRYSTADCIDLPPITHSIVQCEMTPTQQKVYNDMKKEMRHDVSGVSITAANAAVKLLKLVQIGCGAVRTDDEDNAVAIIPPVGRLSALIDAIESVPPDQKVIVFVPFRAVLSLVIDHIREQGYSVAEIHGGVATTTRNDVFSRFQFQADPRILVAIPMAMSHGLNLTAASTVIWYAGIWDAEVYEQANGRVARPSQKNHMSIIHIQGTDVERYIYGKLTKKVTSQLDLLDLYKKIINS